MACWYTPAVMPSGQRRCGFKAWPHCSPARAYTLVAVLAGETQMLLIPDDSNMPAPQGGQRTVTAHLVGGSRHGDPPLHLWATCTPCDSVPMTSSGSLRPLLQGPVSGAAFLTAARLGRPSPLCAVGPGPATLTSELLASNPSPC